MEAHMSPLSYSRKIFSKIVINEWNNCINNNSTILDVLVERTLCVNVSFKVRKAAKIRNRYNQVTQLTQDTTWESDKITI